MKKLILISVFSCLIISSLQAQKPFDEAIFNGMLTRWVKEPVSFYKNECDSQFMFTNGNGESYSQEKAIATYTNIIASATKKVENLKVWQVGNTGIATGKTIESYVYKNGGTAAYAGIFTYTFSQQNGKWMMVSAQHTDYKTPKANDEMTIRQTCENETKYFHEADTKNWDSQWSQKGYVEYQSQYLKELIKTPFAKGEIFVGMKNNVAKTRKPDGLMSKVTDFEARINGNMAWATYTQEDFKGENSNEKSRQLRILEKVNGSWKIVGLSIQKI